MDKDWDLIFFFPPQKSLWKTDTNQILGNTQALTKWGKKPYMQEKCEKIYVRVGILYFQVQQEFIIAEKYSGLG